MLLFATEPVMETYLPPGDDHTHFLNITIHIRDMFDCVSELHPQPVFVRSDSTLMNTLMSRLQQTNNGSTEKLPVYVNRTILTQMLGSLPKHLNQMVEQYLNFARQSQYRQSPIFELRSFVDDYSLGNISVAPLGSQRLHSVSS